MSQGLSRFSGAALTADEWAWGVETIREVGLHAKDLVVRLVLEPLNRFEMYIVNTMADAARFVRDVGVASVGLLADTIYHVHISENFRGVPGQGQAIKPGLFRMLREIGYQGWLTIEGVWAQNAGTSLSPPPVASFRG